jgi:hypothetical protein
MIVRGTDSGFYTLEYEPTDLPLCVEDRIRDGAEFLVSAIAPFSEGTVRVARGVGLG